MNAKKTFLCALIVSCLFLVFPEKSIPAPSYEVSVLVSQGGKITPAGSSINAGANKSFSVKPNKGFHVAEIRVDGATIFEDRKGPSTPNDGMSPPLPTDIDLQRSGASKVYKYTFQNVQQNHSLEADFETDTFALHVSKAGLGAGIVESAPAGISCGNSCVGIFPYNSTVTFTATGDEGSVFDGWTGKCKKGAGGSCTMNIKKESTLTAAFARAFKLSISIAGNGGVSSSPKGFVCDESCSQQVKENSTVKLKGKAATDSAFLGWTGCTKLSGSTCSVSMSEDRFVEVAFVSRDVPLYDLNTVSLPQSLILPTPSVLPKQNGAYGHCYLESLAAQMAWIDPSVTMEEIFSFSGLGGSLSYSSWAKAFSSSPPDNWTWSLQTRAMRAYGVQFVVGYSAGMSREYLKGAAGQVIHASADEALKNLKAALRSGRPAQVHIDLYYLPSDFFSEPIQEPGASHFIIINGYDTEGVYTTGVEPDNFGIPIDPSEYVNVKIPLAAFMKAWEEAGKINKGVFTYCAPYWMLFLKETDISEIHKTSPEDVLSLHRSLAQNNGFLIEQYAQKDFTNTQWWKIAMAKYLFADYLRGRGFSLAADAYESLANDYSVCQGLSLGEQKSRLETVIKPLEIEARRLF